MTIKQFFRIVEIRTKLVSFSTLLLAFIYSYCATGHLDLLWALVVFLASLFIDMGTTAFNTFFDFDNRTDSKGTNREADKVLVHEGVPSGYALVTAIVLSVLGGGIGIALAFKFGPLMLLFGILSLAAGFLYSGGPLPISRTPFGELFAGGFLGTVLFFVVCLSQGVELGWAAFLASVPSLVHIAAILTVNNTCDIEGDKVAGRKTISILLGPGASKIFLGVEIFLVWVFVLLTNEVTAPTVALVVFGLLGSAVGLSRMFARGLSHETKGPSMGGISRIFLLFTVVYAAVLAF